MSTPDRSNDGGVAAWIRDRATAFRDGLYRVAMEGEYSPSMRAFKDPRRDALDEERRRTLPPVQVSRQRRGPAPPPPPPAHDYGFMATLAQQARALLGIAEEDTLPAVQARPRDHAPDPARAFRERGILPQMAARDTALARRMYEAVGPNQNEPDLSPDGRPLVSRARASRAYYGLENPDPRVPGENYADDLYRLSLGIPQAHGLLAVSKYHPDSDTSHQPRVAFPGFLTEYAYSPESEEAEDAHPAGSEVGMRRNALRLLVEKAKAREQSGENKNEDVSLSQGTDSIGPFLSYHYQWTPDLARQLGAAQPVDLYDRLHYDKNYDLLPQDTAGTGSTTAAASDAWDAAHPLPPHPKKPSQMQVGGGEGGFLDRLAASARELLGFGADQTLPAVQAQPRSGLPRGMMAARDVTQASPARFPAHYVGDGQHLDNRAPGIADVYNSPYVQDTVFSLMGGPPHSVSVGPLQLGMLERAANALFAPGYNRAFPVGGPGPQGNSNPVTGAVRLNSSLEQAPRGLVEKVVAHELGHIGDFRDAFPALEAVADRYRFDQVRQGGYSAILPTEQKAELLATALERVRSGNRWLASDPTAGPQYVKRQNDFADALAPANPLEREALEAEVLVSQAPIYANTPVGKAWREQNLRAIGLVPANLASAALHANARGPTPPAFGKNAGLPIDPRRTPRSAAEVAGPTPPVRAAGLHADRNRSQPR